MSGFEGPILKGMNPFSNNKPRLTASERIRNKRDATIYQTEKQQFQNKKICGNKNVKYYDNGTIRSIKSYKLQKSLARGSVLCEDCDDKGLLCDGPVNKDALASIQMGNNKVSEYWGEGELVLGSDASGNILVQHKRWDFLSFNLTLVVFGVVPATDINPKLIYQVQFCLTVTHH